MDQESTIVKKDLSIIKASMEDFWAKDVKPRENLIF